MQINWLLPVPGRDLNPRPLSVKAIALTSELIGPAIGKHRQFFSESSPNNHKEGRAHSSQFHEIHSIQMAFFRIKIKMFRVGSLMYLELSQGCEFTRSEVGAF